MSSPTYLRLLLPRNSAVIQNIDWQLEAATNIATKLGETGQRGVLLRGSTGYGKMFITAEALSQLAKAGKLVVPEGSVNPFPILWLCPKSVKPQTAQVLKAYGLSNIVMLMSYGQIKNRDGTDMFLSYQTKILPNGQPSIEAVWSDLMLPAIVVCDESHKLKNRDSLISRVIRAIPSTVKMLFTTATPVQRVADGAYLIEGCSAVTKHNMLPATATTCPAILREIAYPKDPFEYSPSATQRFREAMDDYIVELRSVRFKFPTKTTCTTIQFNTPEQRREYELAYEEYLRKLREIRKDFTGHGRMAALVAMRKFQEKAELLRTDEISSRAVVNVAAGKQVIIASNYLNTLRSCWVRLTKQHGIDAERISFIVGGQSEKERQAQIDKFQRGDADIMLFTMTAGGVGISLHHDRTTSRPRHVILPPTWSAIDLVQALGRAHRLTSLSPTTQEILWYGDTVEDKVKVVVERKTKCLSKAIIAREQFVSIFEKQTDEDADEETNEEYNKIMDTPANEAEANEDESSEVLTGEGLDSVDELPTTY